ERLEVRLLELARAGIGARVLAEEHHVAGGARVGAADSILELRAAERAEGLRGAHAARARLPARAGDVARAEVEGGVEHERRRARETREPETEDDARVAAARGGVRARDERRAVPGRRTQLA